MPKTIITGITGQDGSYLSELLLKKGYEVHGIIRKSSSFNTGRIDHLYADKDILNKTLFLHYGDLVDTSNLFGKVQEVPQSEKTPFYPRSPYGVAKLYGYWIIVNYREAYDIFACNGILFNHESPRRGETFVTRKITRAVSSIAAGIQKTLALGNLDAKRDWGLAPEYCEGMWKILQYKKAEDFVLATGETHTVREC